MCCALFFARRHATRSQKVSALGLLLHLFGLLHVLCLLDLLFLLEVLLEVPLEVPLQEATQLRELGASQGSGSKRC